MPRYDLLARRFAIRPRSARSRRARTAHAPAAAPATPAPDSGTGQRQSDHDRPGPRPMAWSGCLAARSGWAARTATCRMRCRCISSPSPASGWIARRSPTRSSRGSWRRPKYVTVAERPLNAGDFPGVPADKLVPGSAVFRADATPVPLDNPLRWWVYTPGASWKHPQGPAAARSNGRGDHPVGARRLRRRDRVRRNGRASVCRRKPSSSSPRAAASIAHRYSWGNDMRPGNKAAANIWQGTLPGARRRRRWLHGHVAGDGVPDRMASGCTTWAATSGSGARTGIAPTTTRRSCLTRSPPIPPGLRQLRSR